MRKLKHGAGSRSRARLSVMAVSLYALLVAWHWSSGIAAAWPVLP